MRIGLCMIVKNEAAVIKRCLDSVRLFTSSGVICDTGSTDGTQDAIAACGSGWEVISEPWRNFSYNRNVALDACRQRGFDFALVIDADDVLEYAEDFIPPDLSQDCYDITIWNGQLRYHRPQLVRLSKPFHYRGVVHEFLECAEPFTRSHLERVRMTVGQDGARRKSPSQYSEDAYTLRQALLGNEEPDLAPRYTFYIAQSLRDSQQHAPAYAAYLRRAGMGGFWEEVAASHYNAGLMAERLKMPPAKALEHYMAAMELWPGRAEPYHAATRLCNWSKMKQAGWMFARAGARNAFQMPGGGLFVERPVYDYQMLDEFAISAINAGAKDQGAEACRELLAGGHLPPESVERVKANLGFAESALNHIG